jgi:hypothetical protein
MLKVHWRKGDMKGATLNAELSVNKHRKGSEDRADRWNTIYLRERGQGKNKNLPVWKSQ